jgi:hypothetical protein
VSAPWLTLFQELQVVQAAAGHADLERTDLNRRPGRRLNLGRDPVGRKARPQG